MKGKRPNQRHFYRICEIEKFVNKSDQDAEEYLSPLTTTQAKVFQIS